MSVQHMVLSLNDGILDTDPIVVNEVVLLQKCLVDWAVLDGSVDGQFGDDTFLAVKLFQKKKDLVVDGIVPQQNRLIYPHNWAQKHHQSEKLFL